MIGASSFYHLMGFILAGIIGVLVVGGALAWWCKYSDGR